MGLGHEKLDVYRLSIGYVARVYEKAGALGGIHRAARDQWLRASQSIPLNIAEGNGKTAEADRRQYYSAVRRVPRIRNGCRESIAEGRSWCECQESFNICRLG
jgi:four helix bundle protein